MISLYFKFSLSGMFCKIGGAGPCRNFGPEQEVSATKIPIVYSLQSRGVSVSDWGMSVFDGACQSPMGHVGLQWGISVSDEACWSLMGHVGLKWGMCVSDGVCWSPTGHFSV